MNYERIIKAYLGLGTNLGDRLSNLQRSLKLLFSTPGIELESFSNIYETEPVGGPQQGPFLNACLAINTELSPVDLLLALLSVEEKMQRVREERWGPRIIDFDLLIYEGVTINTPLLQLPHPRLAERDFVLVPLSDIAPELIITSVNKTVQQVLAERKENPDVKLYRLRNWFKTT